MNDNCRFMQYDKVCDGNRKKQSLPLPLLCACECVMLEIQPMTFLFYKLVLCHKVISPDSEFHIERIVNFDLQAKTTVNWKSRKYSFWFKKEFPSWRYWLEKASEVLAAENHKNTGLPGALTRSELNDNVYLWFLPCNEVSLTLYSLCCSLILRVTVRQHAFGFYMSIDQGSTEMSLLIPPRPKPETRCSVLRLMLKLNKKGGKNELETVCSLLERRMQVTAYSRQII